MIVTEDMDMLRYDYAPDRWMMIEIKGDVPHYKIFGSWFGGYLGSNSWRMNSGITSVEEDETCYYFAGSSGSTYRCGKEFYGANMYGWGVAKSFEEKHEDKFRVMTEEEAMAVIEKDEWIIT